MNALSMTIKLAERIQEELKKGHEHLHVCMHEGEIDVRPRHHSKSTCRVIMKITRHEAQNGLTGNAWNKLQDLISEELQRGK